MWGWGVKTSESSRESAGGVKTRPKSLSDPSGLPAVSEDAQTPGGPAPSPGRGGMLVFRSLFAGLTCCATRTPMHVGAPARARVCVCAHVCVSVHVCVHLCTRRRGGGTDRAPRDTHFTITPRVPLRERWYWSNHPHTEEAPASEAVP